MDAINTKVIYKIRNIINNKIYVGSTVNFKNRRQEHFRDLTIKSHHSTALQRAFIKYGKESFVFEIIEFVDDKNNLIKREQFYIDTLKPEYNCSKVAGSTLGLKKSPESNLLNSIRNRGEKNAKAKLKDNDIFTILKLRETMPVDEIASLYNVSHDSISRVLNGKSFKHLNREKVSQKRILTKSAREKIRQSRIGKASAVSIPVKVKNKKGEYLGHFRSIREASINLKIALGTLYDAFTGRTKNPFYQIEKINGNDAVMLVFGR